jgi:polyisoprenyl-phosphate glycosyltransferase
MSQSTQSAAMASPNSADSTQPEISVVVPLYNEEENIPELYRRLSAALSEACSDFELIFVNDGSTDATPVILSTLQGKDPRVVVIHLSRNFGHQPAISAGIDHARGRAVILMDGDLQDPPEVLPQFIQAWRNGHEVVYAIRTNRKEGLVKRACYAVFYRLLRSISDLDIPLDSGDFCLMDQTVVDVLRRLPERIRFVRGLRTFVGFRQIGVSYERAHRSGGKPKYTFRALLSLAVDGLISFSSYPLHLVTYLGLLAALAAVVVAFYVLYAVVFQLERPVGWASTVMVILFMGAVQLLSLGIMGQYIRRIFIETKGRPTYIVRTIQSQPRPRDGAVEERAPDTLGVPRG